MAKLSEKEIEQKLNDEGLGGVLPRDAHSVFSFKIEESSQDLLKEMKELPKKRKPDYEMTDINGETHIQRGDYKVRWEYSERNDKIYLTDRYVSSGSNVAVVTKTDEGLEIETAWGGYKYTISDNKKGGANVEFHGPVNALLKQDLLPPMTYVPHTLKGKFVDSHNGSDLTPYMDISTYGVIRKAKNTQVDNVSYEQETNPQDVYGSAVNKMFNNEIDFLPQFKDAQVLKNEKAQKQYENGHIEATTEFQKQRIKKHIDAVKGKLSGAVKVDQQIEAKQNKIVANNIKKGREY